jgi:hypothetical protein
VAIRQSVGNKFRRFIERSIGQNPVAMIGARTPTIYFSHTQPTLSHSLKTGHSANCLLRKYRIFGEHASSFLIYQYVNRTII